MASLPFLLQLPDGSPPIPCRDAYQALLLARLWYACEHGEPLRGLFNAPGGQGKLEDDDEPTSRTR